MIRMRNIMLTVLAAWIGAVSVFGALPVLRVQTDSPLEAGMAYVNGSMELTVDGQPTIRMAARIKTRGATAQQYMMKPSFNIKLRTADYAQELDTSLLGMRSCSSWIVDAMAIDRICMRNRVAFDIWNDFSRLPYETKFEGRNGTEGRFVEVYINGAYYGIYCLSDRINRKLLALGKVKEVASGVEFHGALYKHGTQDIGNQNEPTYSADSAACVVSWHNAWELTYPDEYGCAAVWAPLQEAYAVGQSKDYVKRYFYMQNLADYQLLIMALAIQDNWGNKNRFFSVRDMAEAINGANGEKRKLVMTPWDLDTSLGGKWDGSHYGGTYTEWALAGITGNAPYPQAFLQDDADYQALLKQRWKAGRAKAFSVDSVNVKLERYRDLFLQSGAWQRMVDHFESKASKPLYVTDLAGEIALIEAWYAARFQQMDEYFGLPDGLEQTGEAEAQDDAYYDLLGRRYTGAVPGPGIYIHRGQKVVVK